MYHHATSTPLSCLRFFVVCAVLLLGAAKEGYGQRVYADSDMINGSYSLLNNGVRNHVNAIGDNHNTSSEIIVNVTGFAWQILRFTGPVTPTSKSPVTIKFEAPPDILELLGGVRVQKMDGLTQVGDEYTNNQLLDLLGLFSSTTGELQLPAGNNDFDGVRVYMNSTLGLLTTVNYFYAFFITPPRLQSSSITICQWESTTINLSNFETGYKYKVYSTETAEEPIAVTESSSVISLPIFETPGDYVYWVEAVDSDIYISERVPFTVTVTPHPGKPQLSISGITN